MGGVNKRADRIGRYGTLRVLGNSKSEQQHQNAKDMRHVSSETENIHTHAAEEIWRGSVPLVRVR